MRGSVYYIAADDSTLMSVQVSGTTLLDWVQYSLTNAPFYFQAQQIVVGFDSSQVPRCRVNMLQVEHDAAPVSRHPWSVVRGIAGSGQRIAQRRRALSDLSRHKHRSAARWTVDARHSRQRNHPEGGVHFRGGTACRIV